MVRFGPAGNCKSFYDAGYKKTLEAPKWLAKIGLNAYEYSFGKGILLNNETAQNIGEEMKKYNIAISVHAPYFINFASLDEQLAENSFNYVLKSIEKLKLFGGNRIVVHPASVGKSTREDALLRTKIRLEELKNRLIETQNTDIYICLETMGKMGQIGSYKEIIDLCTIYEKFIPTFDFGHINALTHGGLKTESDFNEIFDYCEEKLGKERTNIAHIHFSKIEYGDKGEIKHLTLEDEKYGPDFINLAKVIKKRQLNPIIICESKEIMAIDAIKLKNIYENV